MVIYLLIDSVTSFNENALDKELIKFNKKVIKLKRRNFVLTSDNKFQAEVRLDKLNQPDQNFTIVFYYFLF